MSERRGPTLARAVAILGVLFALGLATWVGVVVLSPNLGTDFDEQLPGSRSQHLAVRRLRGLTGTRYELLLLPDYDGGAPSWRLPLPRGARDVVLTPALAVLRTPRDEAAGAPQLEAYTYGSGELVWRLEDDHFLARPPLRVDALGLLLEVRERPMRVRAIELADGRVRWELEDPAITPDLRLERVLGPELLVRSGAQILAISAGEGTRRPLGPPGALSVQVCGELVVSLDGGGALRIGRLEGGESTEVGHAPAGTVSCATDGARTLVGWTSATRQSARFEHARHRELDLLADGVVLVDAPGAVLAIEGAGTPSARRIWAATTRWGGPSELRLGSPCRLGLEHPGTRGVDIGDEEPVARLPQVLFDCATGAPWAPAAGHD